MSIVIVDNFDSFTYNLSALITAQSKRKVIVHRRSDKTLDFLSKIQVSYLVLSPGPGSPKDYPVLFDLIDYYKSRCPILGVCLGFQAVGEFFGATIQPSTRPVHGETSLIYHKKKHIFSDITVPFSVCRYHSLRLSNIPDCLDVLATTKDMLPMAISHRNYQNIVGVQFHPESFLSEKGDILIKSFLQLKNSSF